MSSIEPEIGLMLYNNAISKETLERVIFYYAEIICFICYSLLTTNIVTLKLTRSMIGDVSIIV